MYDRNDAPQGLIEKDFVTLLRPEVPKVGWYCKWKGYTPYTSALGGPFKCIYVDSTYFKFKRDTFDYNYLIESNAYHLLWYKGFKKKLIIIRK